MNQPCSSPYITTYLSDLQKRLKLTSDMGNAKLYSKLIVQFHISFAKVDSVRHHYLYVMYIKICRGKKNCLYFTTPLIILEDFAEMQKSPISFVMSPVCLSFNGAPIRIITVVFLIIFRKSVEKIQDSLNSDKNNNTVHEGLCTFMIISTCVLIGNTVI
jgi:hypothetical protein